MRCAIDNRFILDGNYSSLLGQSHLSSPCVFRGGEIKVFFLIIAVSEMMLKYPRNHFVHNVQGYFTFETAEEAQRIVTRIQTEVLLILFWLLLRFLVCAIFIYVKFDINAISLVPWQGAATVYRRMKLAAVCNFYRALDHVKPLFEKVVARCQLAHSNGTMFMFV